MEPEIRYAKSGEHNIAYQVLGEGPIDVVLVWGFASNLEWFWEDPACHRFLRRLAGFCRLITFDKHGTGLSDPVAGVPTLEQRMDDVRAVMAAVGSERAALFGDSEAGPMCALFAATYPDRVSGLIMWGSYACGSRTDDYPWGLSRDELDQVIEVIVDGWGRGITVDLFTPSLSDDARAREQAARFERVSASPGMVRALALMAADVDVRPVLPTISAPTLIVHGASDPIVTVDHGKYLAEHIPGAKFLQLAGAEHDLWRGDVDLLLAEVEQFLTGVPPANAPDRVLATLVFTDIVDSTTHASSLGDRRWRELLESHDALVRRQIERLRGKEIKTTGDGFLVAFDGPARAIRFAQATAEAVRRLGIEIRAGLHTGECEIMDGDIGGVAVHTAARVVERAQPGAVLISRTVKDLVAGSRIELTDAGTHSLKGIPGEWQLFAVKQDDDLRSGIPNRDPARSS